MANIRNLLKRDIFSVASQTAHMRESAYSPLKLSKSGLFTNVFIDTPFISVQLDTVKTKIIVATARGARGTTLQYPRSKVYQMQGLYFPIEDYIAADEIYDLGHLSDGEAMVSVQRALDVKQQVAMDSFRETWEFGRCGAVHGVVQNAPVEGATTEPEILYDLYEMFKIPTPPSFDFALSNDNVNMKATVRQVTDYMDANGAATRTGLQAWCSPEFYDAFVENAQVKEAYDRWEEGRFFRENSDNFTYLGVEWIRYYGTAYAAGLSGTPAAKPWIKSETCRFTATGIPDLFQTVFPPADFVETVGKPGTEFVFKTWPREDDRGINTLAVTTATSICTLPQTLVEGTMS